MQLGWASSRLYKASSRCLFLYSNKRTFTVGLQRKAQDVSTEVSRTRNIGIIAHIDAVCYDWALHSSCRAHDIQGQDDDHGAHALL